MQTFSLNGTEITFPHQPVLVCYRGSQAHGTYIPPEDPDSVDDIDLFAVCVPPMNYFLGLKQWAGKDFWVNEYDIVAYNLDKFIRLLLKGNPNVHQALWVKPEHILYCTEIGEELIAHRDRFIGKVPLFNALTGYAQGQFKRMTQSNPYQGYMGEKRRHLVNQFGYDPKNASHLIRLQQMCLDFLLTGEFRVWREDAADLIDIKRGKWSLDAVKEYSQRLHEACQTDFQTCMLPDYADTEWADLFLIRLLRNVYGL